MLLLNINFGTTDETSVTESAGTYIVCINRIIPDLYTYFISKGVDASKPSGYVPLCDTCLLDVT